LALSGGRLGVITGVGVARVGPVQASRWSVEELVGGLKVPRQTEAANPFRGLKVYLKPRAFKGLWEGTFLKGPRNVGPFPLKRGRGRGQGLEGTRNGSQRFPFHWGPLFIGGPGGGKHPTGALTILGGGGPPKGKAKTLGGWGAQSFLKSFFSQIAVWGGFGTFRIGVEKLGDHSKEPGGSTPFARGKNMPPGGLVCQPGRRTHGGVGFHPPKRGRGGLQKRGFPPPGGDKQPRGGGKLSHRRGTPRRKPNRGGGAPPS